MAVQNRRVGWIVGVIATGLLVTLFVLQAQFFMDARSKRLGEPVNPAPNPTNSQGAPADPQAEFNLTTSFTAATLMATSLDELSQLNSEAQRVGVDPDLLAMLNDLAGRALAPQAMAHDWLLNGSHQGLAVDLPEALAEVHVAVRPTMLSAQSLDGRTAQAKTVLNRLYADFELIRQQYEPAVLDVDVRQALISMTFVYGNFLEDIDKL